MLYEKWPIQISFLIVWNFLQSIFIPQDHKMHSQEVINLDIIGHFWKSTKTPFFPKLITWACNIKMKWDQKGWLEDISRFLESPIKLPKVQNWRSYALLKLGIFAKLPKVNYPQNFKFCQMGPFLSTWFDLVTLHTCPSFSLVSIY